MGPAQARATWIEAAMLLLYSIVTRVLACGRQPHTCRLLLCQWISARTALPRDGSARSQTKRTISDNISKHERKLERQWKLPTRSESQYGRATWNAHACSCECDVMSVTVRSGGPCLAKSLCFVMKGAGKNTHNDFDCRCETRDKRVVEQDEE